MIHKVPTLQKLISLLQKVPYLASKNLFRVATHFLSMNPDEVEQFCAVLLAAKRNVVPCQTCFFWIEKEQPCIFCDDKKRDQTIVCVVESWQELLAIEKTGGYEGVYHVLGGVICPLDGVGPDDLTIVPLTKRVASGVKEIILAMNQTPEGEATAAFIARQLDGMNVTISCLARGIPVGSSLEFMDRLTVYKALSERRPF